VNYTRRKTKAAGPGVKLPSHRTPAAVLKQIELAIGPSAAVGENSGAALALADRLWEEGSLESRLLAAFMIGHVPPNQEQFSRRLSSWISQSRDGDLRNKLLDQGLARLRREARSAFLQMLQAWLTPEQTYSWGDAIRAATAALQDPSFTDVPPLLQALEPALRASPPRLQLEVEELIKALYGVSPSETTYYVRRIVADSSDPSTAAHFRRMAPSLPPELRTTIREVSGRSRLSPG
jgi:hypothetical protein